jgi:hypothetical protein
MIEETTVLIFPDNTTLSDFLLEHSLSNVQVDSLLQAITGTIPEELIKVARLQYEVILDSRSIIS